MYTIKRRQSRTQGFVALMGSVVISMVLLIITTEAVWLGWSTRYMVLNLESKELSVHLAHLCAAQSMSRLVQNPQYLGNETISYSYGACQIESFSFSPESEPKITVRVRVASGRVVTKHEYEYQLTGIKTGEPLPATTMSATSVPTVQLVNWREW